MFENDQHNFLNDVKLFEDSDKLLELVSKEMASLSGTSDDPVK